LSKQRVLVEDTYYSESSELDREKLRQRIRDYVADQGWRISGEHREESGVLPIVLDGDAERYWQEAGTAVARAGMRALLFHHTTGYSLPDAVRLADLVASVPELSTVALAPAIKAHSLARWDEQGFFRLLNRLMFEAARPAERYRTLQHFYRCSERLIGRFYAGRPGPLDPLRILSGRPPVPLGRALGCLLRGPRRQPVPAAVARRGL
jgi:lycopene beta-cyclase